MGGPWSRELCGGTHVQHSSQIGLVTITGEQSVGSGVRRVEAFVGIEAFRYLAKERALVLGLTDALKVQPDQLTDRVDQAGGPAQGGGEADRRPEEPQRAGRRRPASSAERHDMWGVGYVGHRADGVDGNDLRTLALEIRNRLADTARGGRRGRRPGGEAQRGRRHHPGRPGPRAERPASWSGAASETLGGRGGGKDDIAQGGGTDGARAAEALKAVEHAIGHRLQS